MNCVGSGDSRGDTCDAPLTTGREGSHVRLWGRVTGTHLTNSWRRFRMSPDPYSLRVSPTHRLRSSPMNRTKTASLLHLATTIAVLGVAPSLPAADAVPTPPPS